MEIGVVSGEFGDLGNEEGWNNGMLESWGIRLGIEGLAAAGQA